MINKLLNLLSILTLSVIVLNNHKTECETSKQLHSAIAIISDRNGSVSGQLRFKECDDHKILIVGQISGLKPGKHGMHVHQYGDLSEDCNSTGAHFDDHKTSVPHGGRNDSHGHTGDFGNIVANDQGIALVNISDSFVHLYGEHSIVGRAVVVHVRPDDLGNDNTDTSHVTGSVGAAAGCGIVGYDN